MIKKKFKIKFEGPPGCGKDTFMGLIKKKIKHEDINIWTSKEHELEVEITHKAFPSYGE